MRIKEKPEDFVVREAYRFEKTKRGEYFVYLMDKQKLSTFDAVSRIAKAHKLRPSEVSFCGLKDKQGRTEQIVAVHGQRIDLQTPDLRLKFLGRTDAPLSARNLTANRFVVTVRDLTVEEAERVPASVREVRALGVVNYFDSQRFGGVKHGQGFLAKDLAFGRVEQALKGYLAQPSPLDRSEDAKIKAFWKHNWGKWTARCPYAGVARYRPVLHRLRERPGDFAYAFQAIDKRRRAMMVFEYQSYLWNESVRRYLLGRLGAEGHLVLRYQAGRQVFPRHVRDTERVRALAKMGFPLVGPDSTFDDAEIEKAVQDTLRREHVTLAQLGLPAISDMGFKHELRPLMVSPGKLSVVDPRPDERNRGRLKVTLAFTLPPGAYATLVVRRTLWFALRDVLEQGGPVPDPEPGFVSEALVHDLQQMANRAMRSRRRPPRPSHGIEVESQAAQRVREGAKAKGERKPPARADEAPRRTGKPAARGKPRGTGKPATRGKPKRAGKPRGAKK